MIESLASLRAKFAKQASNKSSNFYFDSDDPRKLNHLSLEQQKKRAKELLREWHATPPDSGIKPKLSDAQHAIARAYGFKSWSELKTYIEQAQLARDALINGEPSILDSDQHTLHIRCGNDIQHAMAVAGFVGDFLVFPDPYIHGPVPRMDTLEEFIRIRANFITSYFKLKYDEILKGLSQEYAYLEKARDYDVVYLWSEHDSYDQLLVAKLMDFFSDATKRPPVLKMINITHFPGVKIFNGIGQLPPEAMRVLWDMFTDVTPAQLAIGKRAWSAVCSSSPKALQNFVDSDTAELPTMAIALERHLKQLPSKKNGLNLTENLSLQILHDKGEMDAARLFGWYTNHYEPLAFMGDTGYWNVLEDMATANHPAITLAKQGKKPKEWHVAITDTGRKLLTNDVDWLELNHIDRWVGGIHIDSRGGDTFRVGD